MPEGRTVIVTGALSCAVASDRTCTICVPGSSVFGTCAWIWPLDVASSGTETSPNVKHDPPSTVGGGTVEDAAFEARFCPFTVMNDPGVMLAEPSDEFTMPVAPVLIVGCVFVLVGASETTLKPESVIAYAVEPAESTTICRGLALKRVVPNTLNCGFSGTTATSESDPAAISTISNMVRESSTVVAVMLLRTGVVSRRYCVPESGATAATLSRGDGALRTG